MCVWERERCSSPSPVNTPYVFLELIYKIHPWVPQHIIPPSEEYGPVMQSYAAQYRGCGRLVRWVGVTFSTSLIHCCKYYISALSTLKQGSLGGDTGNGIINIFPNPADTRGSFNIQGQRNAYGRHAIGSKQRLVLPVHGHR